MFILLGRLLYLSIWLFLIINFFISYPKPINIIINIALTSLTFVHLLQAILLHKILTKQEKHQDKWQVFRLFLFGIFEALRWNKAKNKQ